MNGRLRFAVLLLAAAAGTVHAQDRRSMEFYQPGSWNWALRTQVPEAQRLFNAFDYGHAILYERLLQNPADTAALDRAYRFLVEDLLVNPPRFSVPEEAVAPHYAKFAWSAMRMFDWAHVLHRQIYDVYAAPGLADSARLVLVERLTDAYLSRRDVAFAEAPKTMALMNEQPFSKRFREAHPAFNGLIWAYHWLQVGLYDPLIVGADAMAGRDGARRALGTFRRMVDGRPGSYPATMPMTAAVSPVFAERHPRAAAIFDNLHLAHDVISDILADARIPRSAKRAEIDRQLARLRDPTVDLMSPDEMQEHRHGHGVHQGH
jgi:hypothetical protein